MVIVIGKTYSLETKRVLDYLTEMNVAFEYVDLEFEDDEDVSYRHWLKANKIIAIPVVKCGAEFVVGDNLQLINQLITKYQANGNECH